MTSPEPVNVFSGLERYSLPQSPADLDYITEELLLQGHSVIPEVLTESQNQQLRDEIDQLEVREVAEWGKEALSSINDLGVLRNPFLKSDVIVDCCFGDSTLSICEAIFRSQFILSVNRAVINDPSELHPANYWHREPAYQNFTSSKPLSLTFLLAVDPMNESTGGVRILLSSQHWEKAPSDCYIAKNSVYIDVPAGGMWVADSSIIHSNTVNISMRRRSLVTIFTSPLLKQQTNIAKMILSSADIRKRIERVPNSNFIFGLDTDPFDSDDLYRRDKIANQISIG